MSIDFSRYQFSYVVVLPEEYDVLDLSSPEGMKQPRTSPFCIGKYNEVRPLMYTHEMYADQQQEGERCIHMGIDIGAPTGTEVFNFYQGTIHCIEDHSQPGDYGPTLILAHEFDEDVVLYSLFGHLSQESLEGKELGQAIEQGECLGTIGSESINGGWPPHLHFQLSWLPPIKGDMPGVVALKDRLQSLKVFPDPRLVLGPLY
ncbi:MAG: peptidoglycan DD-metalloendopeptidase family protein [Bdellovibrionales bacterium]|nr:peptidoglycan DD-metalloendopeptidase family protein [Bdellovibrionales bacterium]